MKVRITKPGIYGADGMYPVGTEMDVENEPKAWLDRYEVVGKAKKSAVINLDRNTVITKAIKGLKKSDHTADGKPEVNAINAALPDGLQSVDADERDALWEKMNG